MDEKRAASWMSEEVKLKCQVSSLNGTHLIKLRLFVDGQPTKQGSMNPISFAYLLMFLSQSEEYKLARVVYVTLLMERFNVTLRNACKACSTGPSRRNATLA